MKKIIAMLLCTAFIFSFGCNNNKKNDVKKDNENVKIATSFYPMYIFTINLTKDIDNVTVKNITQGTVGCIHNYKLLPKDMVTLDDASLLITNGAGMETFITKVSKQLPNLPIVSASEGVDLIQSNHNHDSNNKNEHSVNGHVWLSVPNAITQVENISKALKKVLPNDVDKIETNKKEYLKRLSALDKQITDELKPYSGTPIMTFHEAYNYFASQYGLLLIGTIETNEGEEPSAKQMAELSATIKEKKVKALFVEPEYKGTSANILASETGIKVYTLNPIITGDNSLTSYEDIMKSNLKVIKEALN